MSVGGLTKNTVISEGAQRGRNLPFCAAHFRVLIIWGFLTAFEMTFKNYSCLKESTGLIFAAFIVWKLTVEIATNNTANPAITKTIMDMVVRYGKLVIQLFIPSHTNGQAIAIAMSTRLTYSLESKRKIPFSL